MIKLEQTEVVGWEPAIRGMRNPMNSWEKSDSMFGIHQDQGDYSYWGHDITGGVAKTNYPNGDVEIGPADHDLMMRLAKAGSVDAKFRRMIVVYVDITAPLYWWKEFDTYKVGTVANSCSTMHKIHAKEFTLEDFSCEHLLHIEAPFETEHDVPLIGITIEDNGLLMQDPMDIFKNTVKMLNRCRKMFLETKDKRYWWQMIQLLPASYNQKRTIMLNYEVLAGIYPKRKGHKLDEWYAFCEWIKSLPYSEIITLEESQDE